MVGVTAEAVEYEVTEKPKRGRPSYKAMAEEQAARIAELEAESAALATMVNGLAGEDPVVLTVGGKPIPEDVAHLVPYANTDQGIAEREAQLAAEGRLADGRVSLTADAADKRIEAYDKSDTPYGYGSPLVETAAEYRKANPDMAVRYLSEMQMSKTGKRGFEFVTDKDGKCLTVGDLKLASIPRHVAESRRRAAVQESNDAIGEKVEEFHVNTEQVNRNAPKGSVAVTPIVGSELASTRGFKTSKVWGKQVAG